MKLRGTQIIESHDLDLLEAEKRSLQELQRELAGIDAQLASLIKELQSATYQHALHSSHGLQDLAVVDQVKVMDLKDSRKILLSRRASIEKQLPALQEQLRKDEQAAKDAEMVAATPEARKLAGELVAAFQALTVANDAYYSFAQEHAGAGSWPNAINRLIRPELFHDPIRDLENFAKGK